MTDCTNAFIVIELPAARCREFFPAPVECGKTWDGEMGDYDDDQGDDYELIATRVTLLARDCPGYMLPSNEI